MAASKVLRGSGFSPSNRARPASLPVQQATVIEMVVNLRTARALGVVLPQGIVLRANRVIE